MRIIIDLQGAQTESRFRGIGRYSLSLSLAIARNCGENEIFVVLNNLFPETIEPIREAFEGILAQDQIRVWSILGPTGLVNSANESRREIAENIREAFIANLRPDVILLTSLFEGFGDDAVTSVGRFDLSTPVAVILYDLIPLVNPDINFKTNPIYMDYYNKKIESLRNCKALLAISESSRNEAISALHFDESRVFNIFGGFDKTFQCHESSVEDKKILFKKFDITRPFLMYTGGADERKNLDSLIHAYSMLPRTLKQQFQLVFVGKMPESNVVSLKTFANKLNIRERDLVFTGYVSEEDLIRLYSSCYLFIFPSLHEGFGLPPLEAMACGAPVIASNLTSLPEVMGSELEYALFDATSSESISKKIEQVLRDDRMRAKLISDGKKRLEMFSWDKVAISAIKSLESIAKPPFVIDEDFSVKEIRTGLYRRQLKRILVSKLDHMGDFILAIPAIMKLRARYPDARIDALIGSWNLQAAEGLGIFEKIFTLDFFSKKSSISPSVLDARVLSIASSMSRYDLALDLRRQSDTRFILLKMPALKYAGYFTGDQTVDLRLSIGLSAEHDAPYVTTELNKISISLQMLYLVDALPYDLNDYIKLPSSNKQNVKAISNSIAIFPTAGNDVKEWGYKNFIELIKLLDADKNVSSISVFLTEFDDSSVFFAVKSKKISVFQGLDYRDLHSTLGVHSLCIANNSYGAHLGSLLGLKVIGIYAGHETPAEWAPVFGDSHVLYSPVDCSPCHIARRGDCMNEFKCISAITPERVMGALKRHLKFQGVESPPLESRKDLVNRLINNVSPLVSNMNEDEKMQISYYISQNLPVKRKRNLYIDISELKFNDAKTGIQRVVRSILKCLLENSPEEFDVVPVYASLDRVGYFEANKYRAKFIGKNDDSISDVLISPQLGDIFLGLDLALLAVVSQAKFLHSIRNHGVKVLFFIHDILPIRMPHYFDQGLVLAFQKWINTIIEFDGVICNSYATLGDVKSYVAELHGDNFNFDIEQVIRFGSDIENSHPSIGVPSNSEDFLNNISKNPCFLMVGTIEPRKGYGIVLDAFEHLWNQGCEINLVIVGKPGWGVDRLIDRISHHPHLNSQFFWLNDISDEYLQRIYLTSNCLIAASEGEGFGLPLIEASKYHLSIIARDIPVFREVAGDNALYFDGFDFMSLVRVVSQWIAAFKDQCTLDSHAIGRTSWEDCTRELMNCLANERHN